uniref:Mitochondrial substrate carrier family protein n=1 Tax=Rhizophora mucronata TaxID=61149 RepID=A0A2P2Q3Z2_RHIMU
MKLSSIFCIRDISGPIEGYTYVGFAVSFGNAASINRNKEKRACDKQFSSLLKARAQNNPENFIFSPISCLTTLAPFGIHTSTGQVENSILEWFEPLLWGLEMPGLVL